MRRATLSMMRRRVDNDASELTMMRRARLAAEEVSDESCDSGKCMGMCMWHGMCMCICMHTPFLLCDARVMRAT